MTRPRVLALGSSAAAVALWRFRGVLRATVAVKATFELVPNGIMQRIAPDDVVTAEINHGNSPLRSVRLTPDLAPYVPGGDVVLTGHAVSPGETPMVSLQTRLVVFDGDTLLVDRRVIVRGDIKDGQPQPFARMPLVYERAFGGIGFTDNPMGVGADTSQRKTPNLLSPDGAEVVACYGPISRVMPNRRRLLKTLERGALDRPVIDFPDDFDWTYYHVSPPGQRVPYLKGHERLVLEGVSAQHPRVVSSLPGARAAARVFGLSGDEPMPVQLVADLLRIDTDAGTCTVVWRGHVPVPSEAALSGMGVMAGVETPSEPIVWPPSFPAAEPEPPPPAHDTSPSVGVEKKDYSRTSVIDATPHGPALPFRPGAAKLPPRPAPRAPAPPPPPSAPGRTTATVEIAPPEDAPQTLPFQRNFVPSGAGPGSSRGVGVGPAAGLPFPPRPAAVPGPPPSVVELGAKEIEDVTYELVREPDRTAPAAPASRPAAPVVPPPITNLVDSGPPPTTQPIGLPRPRPAAAPAPAKGPTLAHDPRFALQLVPWSLNPSRDCLSIIAKTTCELVPDAPAEPCAAPEPLSQERLLPTDRGAVCDYPSDLVLFKPRADILLRGHAHAPGGRASSSEVVFKFGHPAGPDASPPRFERRVLVFGDRVWERGKAGPVASRPEPFSRMPLTWDRAFGGPAFELNPAGKGFREPLRVPRDLSLPNLEDPERRLRLPTQRPAPASPGPIPEAWRKRWSRLGRDAPVFGALCDTLDWTLFQAAPRAQQLPHLRGDEPFEVKGTHSQHPTLKGCLPGLAARAEVTWKAGGAPLGVALALDTVVLDTDAMKVHLVFRGVLPVSDEKEPGIAGVKLVVEKVGA